jgi:hypothetical protein
MSDKKVKKQVEQKKSELSFKYDDCVVIWRFDNLKDLFTPGELKVMITISIILGVLGKFLTNFFKEDDSTTENQ